MSEKSTRRSRLQTGEKWFISICGKFVPHPMEIHEITKETIVVGDKPSFWSLTKYPRKRYLRNHVKFIEKVVQ